MYDNDGNGLAPLLIHCKYSFENKMTHWLRLCCKITKLAMMNTWGENRCQKIDDRKSMQENSRNLKETHFIKQIKSRKKNVKTLNETCRFVLSSDISESLFVSQSNCLLVDIIKLILYCNFTILK